MRRAQALGGSSPSASADLSFSSPARPLGLSRGFVVCGRKGFLKRAARPLLGRVLGSDPKPEEGEQGTDEGNLDETALPGAYAQSWSGTVTCSPRRPCVNPSGINCINFTGACQNNVCVEQLAGGADCAAGWVKDSTVNGQTLIAKCDATTPVPFCKWEAPQPCGAAAQACCATGKCNVGLSCNSSLKCQ